MAGRISIFQQAENESRSMAMRNERNTRCVLNAPHPPHVLHAYLEGRDGQRPCGGGEYRVDRLIRRGAR